MSRHTIASAQGHLVVGWDRPLKQFFIQVWVKGESEDSVEDEESLELEEAVENDDPDEVLEGIKEFGAIAPSGLRERLMLESSGWLESNFAHDWRNGPILGTTHGG